MNFFKPPRSKYTNFFDSEKFEMAWSVYAVMVIVFFVVGVVQYFNKYPLGALTAFIALLHSVIMLILLRIRRKYYLVAILTAIIGTAITQFNLYTSMNSQRYVDLLWIIIISFSVFYTLGSIWGITCLIINYLGLAIYLILDPKDQIMESDLRTTIDLIINTIAAICASVYLLYKIMRSTEIAEAQYLKINSKLSAQNRKVVLQNNEKTVLLKEIHHRVKNNLQVISSMLRLQASEIKDEETVDQFNEAVNRVASMALIHEKMYQNSDLSQIDLKDYITSLIDEIVESHRRTAEISVKITSEIKQVKIEFIVPLALILNELVVNSLKHAFVNTQNAIITISIKNEPNKTKLIYSDNGEWTSKPDEKSFGFALIEIFTEQLDGKFTRDISNGTLYEFEFRNLEL